MLEAVAAGRLPSGAYAGSVKYAGFTSRLGWVVFFSVGSNDFLTGRFGEQFTGPTPVEWVVAALHSILAEPHFGDINTYLEENNMKVRKKISEVMVISCEKIMPLPAILDKAYPCCPLDELEFQLSDNELYDAYREQQKIFLFQDAERHLEFVVFGTEREALDDEAEAAELSSFQEQYGFSYEDATDPDSNFYILDEAVDRFQDEQDCNLPENDVWENIIRNILSELAV